MSAATGTPTEHAIGRFRVSEELGRGGMGVVMLADDPQLRRQVALKFLRGNDADALRGFVEEAQITGQLEHTNIVPVHELGSDANGRHYLAMKRVRGHTLRDVIGAAADANRTWPDDGAAWLEIFGKICDAMAYAHAHGVIHRDLKPENVMIGDFGEVLVMDWGLARPIGAAAAVNTTRREAGDSHQTVDGDIFGTPAFMAPEQARGDVQRMDTRTDVFALGGILYQLLTLKPPYEGARPIDVIIRAGRRDLIAPRRRAPQRRIPTELEAICLKAMAARPADRYASVDDFKADLQAHLANRPVRARRDPALVRVIKWAKRHPATAMTGTVSLLFLCLIAVGAALFWQQYTEQLRRASEAEAIAAQRDRERLEQLARAGRLDDVLRELGGQIMDDKDRSLAEFRKAFNERDPRQPFEEFVAQLGAGRVNAYIAAYDRLFAADASGEQIVKVTADDWFARGMLRQTGRNDHAGAIEDYTRALAVDPDHMLSLFNRGLAHTRLGQHQQALPDYQRAASLSPDDPEAWHALGFGRISVGDPNGAIDAYTRALELKADYPEALYLRGCALRTIGEPVRARRDLERSVQLDEHDADVWLELANVRRDAADIAGAIDAYTRAHRLRPSLHDAVLERARLRLTAGEPQAAIDDANLVLAEDPRHVLALVIRGAARCERGATADAISDLTRALEIEPQHAEALSLRCMARRLAGDTAAALADGNAALKIDPSLANAWFNRAMTKIALRDRAGAIHDLDEALRLRPDWVDALSHRGNQKHESGDDAAALIDIDRALSIEPQNWLAWYSRAAAIQDSDRAAAIVALRNAWRWCPPGDIRDGLAATIRGLGGSLPE